MFKYNTLSCHYVNLGYRICEDINENTGLACRPDLASVPRIFWSLMPPDGRYAKAAIIHDYLYDNALRTKREVDRIFLDGMTVLSVPKWKRTVMYWAVRLFGRGKYGNSIKVV
ncbi:DUF1353 domain-containing protein [Salmonella enterica]|nr:DUF1353 domain-containing protein [Salmonella enterica]EHI9911114.1 DUF1353 domain-containing protein [Salmonella enterica]EHJ0911643.1 DUF1353 domain-containing protein [Salmonella enterica]